ISITRRFFNRSTATLAGIGFALCGVLVFYTGTLLYVELTSLFSLLTLYLLLIADHHWWRYALAGIAFGLLVICRPEMLLMLPFLVFYQIKLQNSKTRHIIIFTLAVITVTISIPIRNSLVARDPVLFTGHSGINFYFGNNPSADGTWQPAKELDVGFGFSHERLKRVAKIVNGRELPWSKASAYWIKQGLNFIFSHPAAYLKLLLRKLLLFFAGYEIPNNYYFETVRPASFSLKLAFVNFAITIALAILGIIFSWPNRKRLFPIYIFIAVYLISSLLFYVLSRLRAPVLPFLLIFAAYALNRLYQFLYQHQFHKFIPALMVTLLCYLGFNLIPVNRPTYAAQAWTQVGNIYLEQKKPAAAVKALRAALGFNPKNYSARYSLIQSYAGLRLLAEAEQEFQQLVATTGDLTPARVIIHLAAARIAIAYRDFNAAIQQYRAALNYDPENPEIYYLLGLVYISLNDLSSAERHLVSALNLDPGHEAARSALSEVRSHL
ncbi:MAG: tetratricopeptide repeat protein, partial [bacterium]